MTGRGARRHPLSLDGPAPETAQAKESEPEVPEVSHGWQNHGQKVERKLAEDLGVRVAPDAVGEEVGHELSRPDRKIRTLDVRGNATRESHGGW